MEKSAGKHKQATKKEKRSMEKKKKNSNEHSGDYSIHDSSLVMPIL